MKDSFRIPGVKCPKKAHDFRYRLFTKVSYVYSTKVSCVYTISDSGVMCGEIFIIYSPPNYVIYVSNDPKLYIFFPGADHSKFDVSILSFKFLAQHAQFSSLFSIHDGRWTENIQQSTNVYDVISTKTRRQKADGSVESSTSGVLGPTLCIEGNTLPMSYPRPIENRGTVLEIKFNIIVWLLRLFLEYQLKRRFYLGTA
jgi:hypothetical protein